MQTMKGFKQLTAEQRCQIEPLKKSGLSQQKIADIIETSQSTISRELRRNTGGCGYRHKQAQQFTKKRRFNILNKTKFTKKVCVIIKEKLAKKWSPEQISNELKKHSMALSHESIYQYIWRDKQQGGILHQQLCRQGKKYNKRYQGKTKRGGSSPLC
jgi:IS30 family transposase